VWKRNLAGFSNQDTADELGMTANAVGAMLSRSRKVLQARANELKLRPSDFQNSGLSTDAVFGSGR
jgi:DNA-directed RNA polymerase specialized sigma24 family protein